MAIQSQPSRISEPFAGSGTKNVIPATNATPSASQAASWASGFPPECSQPISAGGCPVPRDDMNGVLNWLSQGFAFGQDGGVWEWSALADYDVRRLVLGSDGALYWSVAQSGPGTAAGAQNPAANAAAGDYTYWHVAGPHGFTTPISISSPSINQGDTPATDEYVSLAFIGSTGDNRLGTVLMHILPNGEAQLGLGAQEPVAGSTTGSYIIVHYPKSGAPYATAPFTPDAPGKDADIVTRNWLPKDTRLVHTTGDETVAGTKTFSSNVLCDAFRGTATDATGSLTAEGGTSGTGALLFLYGYQHASNAGQFVLRTRNSSGTVDRQLVGNPGGNLLWNGQVIQTSSDERLKTPLESVPDEVLDAWEAVNWGQFKFLDAVEQKGADKARLHLGLIAQRVKAVFEDRGLDACAYGVLCHEEHEATEDEPAVDLWMVRYAEALCMEACCQRRRADRAEARLATLEERLAAAREQPRASPVIAN